ncbi:MAG: phosphoribosyltransferase family protein [Parcubacteria group bacterium]|jgi:uridine monophosphate synthetase
MGGGENMNSILQDVARRIFEKGAFLFGAFRLKLHEKNPNAPLSPFYLNIRNKNNPKPGPLDDEDYDLIAKGLLEVTQDSGVEFDAIAPIPRAGDPIAEAILRVVGADSKFRIIPLSKEEDGGGRRIVPKAGFEYKQGERILLIDDLVTKADTKIEAIKAVESSGCKVVGLVVLVDRQQGGREQIEAAGYKLFVGFTIRTLLDFYVANNMVDKEKYEEAIKYITNV